LTEYDRPRALRIRTRGGTSGVSPTEAESSLLVVLESSLVVLDEELSNSGVMESKDAAVPSVVNAVLVTVTTKVGGLCPCGEVPPSPPPPPPPPPMVADRGDDDFSGLAGAVMLWVPEAAAAVAAFSAFL
jgi:hypothetical protein